MPKLRGLEGWGAKMILFVVYFVDSCSRKFGELFERVHYIIFYYPKKPLLYIKSYFVKCPVKVAGEVLVAQQRTHYISLRFWHQGFFGPEPHSSKLNNVIKPYFYIVIHIYLEYTCLFPPTLGLFKHSLC